MLTAFEGIYRNGRVELTETPANLEESRVVVTFLPSIGNESTRNGPIDLTALGIDETQAADLRGRLKTFITDWDRPEMDVYDAL